MMKQAFKPAIFIALVFAAYACKTITPVTNATFLSAGDGAITVRSSGVGKTQEKAQIAAEQNAFNTLFFRGFPESQQKTPLVGYDEAGAKQQHATYFDDLYGNRRYRTFVTQSHTAGSYDKTLQSVEITINLRALRADLERAGVIRKFGY
ncbi:MAG: hypothetical protein LBR26_04785 [Prevotella sp.]|jgi:hypothetical protein|nr:hypothetical protein [Prevotella sp.]